jgi:predicted LPLAT superfamily acyltransferase
MSEWDGKSKGNLLGYKIFVFCIKYLGVRVAYFVLCFVALYYFLFLKKNNKAAFYYFHDRMGYSCLKARRMVFMSYYTFGQILIDKIAVSAGMRNSFTYEFDGIEKLKELLAKKNGGVLLSAHVGNFEIAEYFLADLDNVQVNLVTSDFEHKAIKDYLKNIASNSTVKFIVIKDDLSHIYQINAALAKNELICFTGDRYLDGVKCLQEPFLGKEANFPAGPFLIASRLKVPVIFVYVMKEKNLHYHLYAREAEVKHRDDKALLRAYVSNLETIIKRYPLQWFNYFDFWQALKNNK